MSLLHAVDSAATFGRHESGVQDNGADAARQGGDDTGYDEAARGMRDERDRSVAGGGLDVGDDRCDLVLDRQGGQICRSVSPAGQVDGEGVSVEVRDQPVPEPGRRAATVDEHDRHDRTARSDSHGRGGYRGCPRHDRSASQGVAMSSTCNVIPRPYQAPQSSDPA